MSLEEDYLMAKVVELESRLDDLEREVRPARFRARNAESHESSVETTSDQSATNYADWSGAQLSDELGRRNLPKSGTKPELIARLTDHDAQQAG